MTNIFVNNEPIEITETASINDVLDQLNIPKKGIAIAVNENIISKASWPNTQLKKSDKLLIIKATQGG